MTKSPQEYKKSEVGIIPNDWEVPPLGDLARMKSGQSITSASIEEHGDFPCYGGNGLRGYTETYTHDGIFPLIGRQGALCGNVTLARGKFFASEHAVVVTPKPGIEAVWLSKMLVYMNLNSISEASAQGGLAVSKILKLETALPNIDEQRAIATALSDMDALIEAKTALLEKKRAIKQGAMQELLTGRRRLPGFAVTPMKKTDIGEIPEDWDVVNIKAVCNIDPDSLSSNTSPDFEFSYISLEGVSKGKLLNFEQKVFKLAPSRARKRPKEGDTLFGTVRPNLQSHYLFAKHAGEFVCSTGFAVLRPVSIYSNFLFQLVLSSLVSVQIDSMISGSNYPAVSSSDVGNLIIPYPKEQEQRAIATVLNDMDAEISVIDEEIIKLRNLKQGMMSELLTGRIRLVK